MSNNKINVRHTHSGNLLSHIPRESTKGTAFNLRANGMTGGGRSSKKHVFDGAAYGALVCAFSRVEQADSRGAGSHLVFGGKSIFTVSYSVPAVKIKLHLAVKGGARCEDDGYGLSAARMRGLVRSFNYRDDVLANITDGAAVVAGNWDTAGGPPEYKLPLPGGTPVMKSVAVGTNKETFRLESTASKFISAKPWEKKTFQIEVASAAMSKCWIAGDLVALLQSDDRNRSWAASELTITIHEVDPVSMKEEQQLYRYFDEGLPPHIRKQFKYLQLDCPPGVTWRFAGW